MQLMLQLCFTWCHSGAVLRYWSSINANCVDNTCKFKLSQKSLSDSWQFQLRCVSSDRQFNNTVSISNDSICARSGHNDRTTGDHANSLTNSAGSNLTRGLNCCPSLDFDPGCGNSASTGFRHRNKPNHSAWLFTDSFNLSQNELLSILGSKF